MGSTTFSLFLATFNSDDVFRVDRRTRYGMDEFTDRMNGSNFNWKQSIKCYFSLEILKEFDLRLTLTDPH